MSKLNELIQELCPDGIEYKHLARLPHIFFVGLVLPVIKLQKRGHPASVMEKSIRPMAFGLTIVFPILTQKNLQTENILSMVIFFLQLRGSALKKLRNHVLISGAQNAWLAAILLS